MILGARLPDDYKLSEAIKDFSNSPLFQEKTEEVQNAFCALVRRAEELEEKLVLATQNKSNVESSNQ